MKKPKTMFVCSDLHIDHYIRWNNQSCKKLTQEFNWQMENFLMPADYCVIAGDISNDFNLYIRFLKWISKKYKMVYWTHGNHDYVCDPRYEMESLHDENFPAFQNHTYVETIQKHIEDNGIENVKWLDGTVYDIPGTSETIGGTMGIADFTYGKSMNMKPYNKEFYKKMWLQWYDSYWGISVEEYLKVVDHELERMENVIDKKPTIMVTHYLPHYELVDKQYRSSYTSGYFVFDGQKLLTKFEKNGGHTWICGHTHKKIMTNNNGVKIMCLPKGYPNENFHSLETCRKYVIELKK